MNKYTEKKLYRTAMDDFYDYFNEKEIITGKMVVDVFKSILHYERMLFTLNGNSLEGDKINNLKEILSELSNMKLEIAKKTGEPKYAEEYKGTKIFYCWEVAGKELVVHCKEIDEDFDCEVVEGYPGYSPIGNYDSVTYADCLKFVEGFDDREYVEYHEDYIKEGIDFFTKMIEGHGKDTPEGQTYKGKLDKFLKKVGREDLITGE